MANLRLSARTQRHAAWLAEIGDQVLAEAHARLRREAAAGGAPLLRDLLPRRPPPARRRADVLARRRQLLEELQEDVSLHLRYFQQ